MRPVSLINDAQIVERIELCVMFAEAIGNERLERNIFLCTIFTNYSCGPC